MTAPINNTSFYADFGELSALKRDAKADSSKALRAAAQQFESLFTNMMLKSMRAASVGDAMTGGNEMDFYQSMFDQQLSVQLSKGKGFGLADMLVQQLSRSGLVSGSAQSGDAAQATQTDSAASGDSTTQPLPAKTSSSASPSTSTSSTNWPPATPEDFVRAVMPHAEAAASRLGVDANTLVAHAALETGWGKHMPTTADGTSSFNFFGIKASTAWQGQSAAATTVEYEQGTAIKRVERFKAYDSPADCFDDYAQVLTQRRYAGAHNTADDSGAFAQALQKGGYATDPAYASKLGAVTSAVRAMQTATQVVASGADS